MKAVKSISWFLGASMFMFGILKFVNPFKSWYTVQVTNSGLGEFSYWLGIAGEITVGITLILSVAFKQKLLNKIFIIAIKAASVIIIVMMLTGIYVHLQPNVPAAVLPLKIKAPYIPAFFMLLALTNIILLSKQINGNPK